MDKEAFSKIRSQLRELVGKDGVYVLMIHDGKDTQAWADGGSRLKMRGLLEVGADLLRDGLFGEGENIGMN